jgi:hypothetical protein
MGILGSTSGVGGSVLISNKGLKEQSLSR